MGEPWLHHNLDTDNYHSSDGSISGYDLGIITSAMTGDVRDFLREGDETARGRSVIRAIIKNRGKSNDSQK